MSTVAIKNNLGLLADYASEEETAAELGVNKRTLARWRAMRVGPPPTAVGRKWYYKRSSVAAWLDRQERDLTVTGHRRRTRTYRARAARLKPSAASVIAAALLALGSGGDAVGSLHDSRGATLGLRDGPNKLIAVFHTGCSKADILAELQRRGLDNSVIEDRPKESSRTARHDDARRPSASTRLIWDRALDRTGTPLATYLSGRGVNLPVPPSQSWAPSWRRADGTYWPAMVARFDDINGWLIGVHRTWIDRDVAGQWHRRVRATCQALTVAAPPSLKGDSEDGDDA
jgi:hypothetical protein